MTSRHRHFTSAIPQSDDDNHRILSFRPRHDKMNGTARRREPAHDHDPSISFILNLAKFEVDNREDDYRHRMIVNGLAFAVLLALILIGVWLAANISDQHHTLHAFDPDAALDSDGHWMVFADGAAAEAFPIAPPRLGTAFDLRQI
jgi:hypothetical protein